MPSRRCSGAGVLETPVSMPCTNNPSVDLLSSREHHRLIWPKTRAVDHQTLKSCCDNSPRRQRCERHLMDERDKKRRRMNTEGESVNRHDDNEKTDGAQIVATDIRPPKDLDSSEIADLSTEEFKIVRTKLTFVDKSEGIKRFFKCPSSGVQITAPRRFGKSTFINMVEEFLMITVDEDAKPINPESSDNYKMFMNLKLGQKHGDFVKKHCGQYPVISMSLKGVQGTTETDVLDSLKIAICKTFKKHSYLLEKINGSKSFKNKKLYGTIETFLKYCEDDRLTELSEVDVTNALEFLSKILYTHFNKEVVILLDEADAPIMQAITDNMADETLKYLMSLHTEMLSAGLKGNRFLARSLVSSCVRLSRGVYSWEANNQYRALFLQERQFSETYGFTEHEVRNLLQNAAFQTVNDFDGVKKWYNGYQTVNRDGAPIYSGWSVINYLSCSIQKEKKLFGNYWAKSGLLEILKKLLVNDEIQKRIDKLIKDENIAIVIAEPTVNKILELKNMISCPSSKLNESQVNFFLQLLWDNGLLNAIEKNYDIAVLKIPNFEIKTEIQDQCYTQSLFEAKYKLKSENIKRYIEALNQLLLTSSNEQESEDEESNEENGELEEGTTEKFEGAMRNLVNAVSLLFSGDATIPANESELHHILFYLTYNNQLFKTQSSRPVVKVSEQLRDAKTSSQNKRRGKHGRKNECDICVTRGTGGLIFELKLLEQDKANENSNAALRQIIDRKYHTLFDRDEYEHVGTKIYVGLCLKKNLDVTAHYLVDSIDINKAKIVCRNK